MHVSDFNYELPDELIARFPPAERRDSRLLAVDVLGDELTDRRFTELPSLLHPGDLLVLNDTRVIPARLRGHKESGGKVEILIERVTDTHTALALVKASKTPLQDSQIRLPGGATARVAGRQKDLFQLQFSVDVADYLEEFGAVPLPPYLGREAEPLDRDRYQCVYADAPGAIAAPTAGLHFDARMLGELDAAGVSSCRVTLHVGAGTFLPLRSAEVESNKLHFERVVVTPEVCTAVEECRARGGRVVAVGTTSVRALEAASAGGELAPLQGETDLFIYPGYRFRSVDSILTNFHLPQSSLLMLVAAFAGTEKILRAYRHAVHAQYRFFSYGDAMLLGKNHEV